MILSFKLKGDVISDHFLMLYFQKDSLDTVRFKNFRTFGGGPGFSNKIVDQSDIWIPKYTEGGPAEIFLKKYHFLRLP